MRVNEHGGELRMQFEEVNGRILSVAKGRGVVSSVSHDASVFAVDVLKDGGNAFDAAFALAFALAVCHPQAGNLGGGGYLLFKPSRSSTPLLYNYRERSSLQAKRESYLNDHGEPDPEKTSFGPRSVCVPGTVKAFFTLHKEFGSLDSKHILNKLSDLARSGCRITEYQAQCLNRLRPKLIQSPGTRKILTKEEGKYRDGDLLHNPDLGDTFEILAAEGWHSFYGGEIAEKIEESVSGNGGFVRVEDLKRYEISMHDPITTELQGHTIFTVPPEGGGSILIEIINILNNEGFADIEPYTPQYYHYLAQAAKIAFIDRMDYMGEYGYRENEVYTALTDTKTNLHRFNLIESNRDIPTPEYLKKLHKTATAKMLGGFEGGTDTTHFSITDTQGNAVSNSYTLNLRYGSKWTVDGTGILMNGTTDSFSFVPGKSNYFGVVGNRANTFEPDKRPASNMAPVLVMRGKNIHFLMGSPGGPTIPTSIAGVLFAVLLHGLDPRRCIAEGRIHHQAWPDTLFREDDPVLMEKINTLAEKGYHIEQRHEPIGDMHAVYRNRDAYTAVSDYRRQGAAASL